MASLPTRRSEPVRIRPYRPADAEALIAVFRSAVHEGARRDYTEAQLQAWAPDAIDAEAWARARADKPTWVAEVDGAPVGFTDLEPDGHIDMLYVAARYQGRGIACALLDAVEAAARAGELARLHTEASIAARPVFERRGFRVLAAETVERQGQTLTRYRMENVFDSDDHQ